LKKHKMSESKIRTIIIDDDKEFLDSLKDNLELIPEIELVGWATRYFQEKKIIQEKKPELVFLDVEMPNKNGFELLNEIHLSGYTSFNVIFYTAYDKYMIDALRESAFDFLLKPVNPEELHHAIDRYKQRKQTQGTPVPSISPCLNAETISLPVVTGLKFIDKNSIVYFSCQKESLLGKPFWEAVLSNHEHIKLKANTTAQSIFKVTGDKNFIQISQSEIINIRYLNIVEFKSHECILLPPFDNVRLKVSRTYLSSLRNKFDWL